MAKINKPVFSLKFQSNFWAQLKKLHQNMMNRAVAKQDSKKRCVVFWGLHSGRDCFKCFVLKFISENLEGFLWSWVLAKEFDKNYLRVIHKNIVDFSGGLRKELEKAVVFPSGKTTLHLLPFYRLRSNRLKTVVIMGQSTDAESGGEFSLLMGIVGCILVFFALAGNVFVIVAHVKDPLKVFQTSSSQFILNIAVVDLIAATFTAIMLLRQFLDIEMKAKNTILYFSMSLSFPSFFVLSVDRFCSVAFPLWHRSNVTVRSCRLCLLGIWLFNGAYEITNQLVLEYVVHSSFISSCLRLAYVMFFFISTQAFYLATCLSLRRQNQQMIARQENGEHTKSVHNSSVSRAVKVRLLNEKHFLITTAIICLMLAVTALPSIIYFKILYFVLKAFNMNVIITRLIILSLRIRFAVNPLVYLWRLKSYRKTLKALCHFRDIVQF